MKRILNLNGIAGPALVAIAIIGLVVPGASLLISHLLDLAGLRLPIIEQTARIFLISGGLLLLLFALLVIAEQIQDQILYRRYMEQRGRQAAGECPFCGNRQIRDFEPFCPICGERIRHL